MDAHAFFDTNYASRHMRSLCEHFAKRVTSECDESHGWVEFPFGRCELTADAVQLALDASSEDAEGLETVISVMSSHLERFAFRENPILNWRSTKR